MYPIYYELALPDSQSRILIHVTILTLLDGDTWLTVQVSSDAQNSVIG